MRRAACEGYEFITAYEQELSSVQRRKSLPFIAVTNSLLVVVNDWKVKQVYTIQRRDMLFTSEVLPFEGTLSEVK